MRLLMVDDHPVVRQGLKQILVGSFHSVVVDEANNGQEALAKAWQNDYDMVLLDITLPDINGLDILKQLKNARPKLPVLVLSIHPEEQYGLRTLRAGACGYLTKESAPDELVAAIQKILLGGRYVTSSLAERMALMLGSDIRKLPHETLSDREYQIMLAICSGKTTGEIAQTISLALKTVSTYRARLLRKMQMKNNAELIRYAIENRLLD